MQAESAQVAANAKPMSWQDEVYDLLRRHDVTQFAYVPDAGHRILIDRSLADPSVQSVALTTEEEGVGCWRARTWAVHAVCSSCKAAAPNLSIVCVDNGHYGETGYQRSHTSLGVDLEKIAAASGIKRTLAIEQETELAAGARLIREGNGASFVLLRVKPTEPPAHKRDLDPATCRTRFRGANVWAA